MKNNSCFRRVLSVVLVLVMVMTLMPRTEAVAGNQALEEDIAARARATAASEILITTLSITGFIRTILRIMQDVTSVMITCSMSDYVKHPQKSYQC